MGSVTWGGAENGEVFAMREGIRNKFFSLGGIMTIDPVCGMRMEEKKPELQVQYAGRKYFFCSEECKQEFEADPIGYVETVAA
jgi:YHS domain-containing protein